MVQLPSHHQVPALASDQTSSPALSQWRLELSRCDNHDAEWLSDEPELESDFHRDQIDVLLRLMRWYWRNRDDVYFSGNTTVYFDPDQRTNRNFRGPDIFVVFGAEKRRRNSWMVWKEGNKYPDVVFELLSNSTANVDRTTKKSLYQDQWKLSNYFWFHPETQEFRGFQLVGSQYQEIQPNALGHLWSDQMNVFVGLHSDGMLRFFTATGLLIPTEEEEERQLKEVAQQQVQAERSRNTKIQQLAQDEQTLRVQAQKQAEQERQRAEQERQRAEQLAARLRQMGLDPEEF